jgi:hypothetical protein
MRAIVVGSRAFSRVVGVLLDPSGIEDRYQSDCGRIAGGSHLLDSTTMIYPKPDQETGGNEMADTPNRPSVMRLILIPSLITLAITILRLVGELQHWPIALFNPAAGGGGALIGISWLPPIFGAYFAFKLASSDEQHPSAGRMILFSLLAIAVLVGAAFVGFSLDNDPKPGSLPFVIAPLVGSIIALVVIARPWPALFKTLLAYAFAARIPVAIVMLFAIYGNWGTHYDVAPGPDFPEMHWLNKWLLIGAYPQLIIWIAYTVLVGSLFGGFTLLAFRRKLTKQPASA